MKPLGGPSTFPLLVPLSQPVVAHQGGWDEILLVLGPLAVVGLLLWLANRRVAAQLEDAESTGAGRGNEG